MGGRPGWFSALQAPGFVVLAGVSGLGHIAVMAALVRWLLPSTREQIRPATFRLLGIFLMVLGMIYLYFTLIEVLTAGYAGHEREQNWWPSCSGARTRPTSGPGPSAWAPR
jgi:Ni/Fe-hydrogenase subunit HybB-like protein